MATAVGVILDFGTRLIGVRLVGISRHRAARGNPGRATNQVRACYKFKGGEGTGFDDPDNNHASRK